MESRPEFLPVDQISRSRNSNRVRNAIPLRISEYVGAVLPLHDPRVFHAARPLSLFLTVIGREEHWGCSSLEMDAVFALRQPKARSVTADLCSARIIFCTIQHKNLSTSHD